MSAISRQNLDNLICKLRSKNKFTPDQTFGELIMRLILIFVALVLSVLTAPFIGNFYAQYTPHYGSFMYDRSDSVFFSGVILSLLFWIPLVIGIDGIKKHRSLILWLTIPIILFVLSSGVKYSLISILLVGVGASLAYASNILIHKKQ